LICLPGNASTAFLQTIRPDQPGSAMVHRVADGSLSTRVPAWLPVISTWSSAAQSPA
jgi:hypothetical protein